MRITRKVLDHVRSNLVAYIALFFALSGTAVAAGGPLIYSDNIVDGQVFSVDVADENLTGVDIQNGSLTGGELANGTVSGQQITNGSITRADIAPETITGSEVADNSLTGADVGWDRLTGDDIAENTLSVAQMGCQSGKVLGFARIHGIALTRDNVSGWTSDPKYIDITNNCSLGAVLVRGGAGFYGVKFVGNPAALAVVTNVWEEGTDLDNILSVQKAVTEGGFFEVSIEDVCDPGNDSIACKDSGTQPQSGDFTILLP